MPITAENLLIKLQDPASLSPKEQLKLGLAFVGASQDAHTKESTEDMTTVMEGGTSLIAMGLERIRTDEHIPEDMKLFYGIRVLGKIDFDQLPDGEVRSELFVETWLTIIAGLETHIHMRIDELKDRWKQGNLQLAAAMRLGREGQELPVRDQLEYLSADLDNLEFDEDQKRQVLIAWAKGNINQDVEGSTVADMVQFFFDMDDNEAAFEITHFDIEQTPSNEIADRHRYIFNLD
jgi:hypothetical protein